MNASAYGRLRPKYVGLVGSHCNTCGAEFFPPLKVCRRCGSVKLEERQMPQTGRLITYTRLFVPSEDFRGQSPMVIGYVELDNGVRLLAQVADVPDEDLKEGIRLKMQVRPLNESSGSDMSIVGYKFVKD